MDPGGVPQLRLLSLRSGKAKVATVHREEYKTGKNCRVTGLHRYRGHLLKFQLSTDELMCVRKQPEFEKELPGRSRGNNLQANTGSETMCVPTIPKWKYIIMKRTLFMINTSVLGQ